MGNIKILTLISFLLLSLSLTITSCKKDIEGCMDPNAENYNPDANVDDGTCVLARDKFIGSYTGTLTCQAPLPNSEGFIINISEGLNDDSQVEMSFENTQAPLPVLIATVDGFEITIEEMETSIALDPNNPDNKTTLVFSGEGEMNEDKDTITGTISVFIPSFGQTLTCEFEAMK